MADKLTTIRIQRVKESEILKLRAIAMQTGYKSENDLLRDMINERINEENPKHLYDLEIEKMFIKILAKVSELAAKIEINKLTDEEVD